jgi:hypothetical protein
VVPTSGTSTGEHDLITLTYATAGLAPGVHTSIVTVAAAGADASPRTVICRVTVLAPRLCCAPPSLASWSLEGQNASNRTIKLWYEGAGIAAYTVATDRAWLRVTPTSGTNTGEQDTVTLMFDSASLGVGCHTGNVVFTASSASNSPFSEQVVLTILAPTADNDGDGLNNAVEIVMGTNPLLPDTDGDGAPDGDEVIAGTDPIDGTDYFRIADAAARAANCVLSWDTVSGRLYTVSTTTNLLRPSWSNLSQIAGDGRPCAFTNPLQNLRERFYRLGVSTNAL